MERALVPVAGECARDAIARAFLGVSPASSALGRITLRAHQESAVHRIRAALAEHGGVLLADEVGLGKTYTALACASHAKRPLVVAPASLRPMWERAMRDTDVRVALTSYEALSRGGSPDGDFDLIVLDEAHHVRSPAARRYRTLVSLSARASFLLLSATPLHNSRRDLGALLALFLGAKAWDLDDEALARHIIRRQRDDVAHSVDIPEAGVPVWIASGEDASLLDSILALPAAVPPRDAGDGGALLLFSLLKQWASSHAALRGALRRRLARAHALETAFACGRYPSRSELSAWTIGEEAIQLAFPELIAPANDGCREMLDIVRAHATGIRDLMERIPHPSPLDAVRAERLRGLRRIHAGEKIVAFSQYGDTVRAFFQHMRTDAGVAELSARGARVAGGQLGRREALERFVPVAMGVRPPRQIERIDLLLTTDLLSEGVNLQDASVVVHLDLPWTPARLEQRVGRSRRIGAAHQRTAVYALAPPAEPESLLRIEERLRCKLSAAVRAVGVAGVILPWSSALAPPSAGTVAASPSPTRRLELLRSSLLTWLADGARGTISNGSGTLIAAVRSPSRGALALLVSQAGSTIVASLGAGFTDDASVVSEVMRLAAGADIPVDEVAAADAISEVARWIAGQHGRRAAGTCESIAGTARRRAIQRITAITSHAPLHRRPMLATLAAQARRAVSASYGAGGERVLGELAAARLSDEAWLRALDAFGEANARRLDEHDLGDFELRVLIVLQE